MNINYTFRNLKLMALILINANICKSNESLNKLTNIYRDFKTQNKPSSMDKSQIKKIIKKNLPKIANIIDHAEFLTIIGYKKTEKQMKGNDYQWQLVLTYTNNKKKFNINELLSINVFTDVNNNGNINNDNYINFKLQEKNDNYYIDIEYKNFNVFTKSFAKKYLKEGISDNKDLELTNNNQIIFKNQTSVMINSFFTSIKEMILNSKNNSNMSLGKILESSLNNKDMEQTFDNFLESLSKEKKIKISSYKYKYNNDNLDIICLNGINIELTLFIKNDNIIGIIIQKEDDKKPNNCQYYIFPFDNIDN